ncbi:tryptophan 7-halogenase [Paraneptunicella aestuarii]|uniref:tryptophan halogenase family protein n=1 Tax=Paraneptunicella aestuarii TaxID=2831148 RepID=UPI001E4B758A|nr:tryptophan halogenase family protein [Paraneptunicella aestuarii]UAA40348.1 tryptophan 7-halogenase [Paraneptunicella aestuarii]
MQQAIRKIVVLGGGAAGWLTAGRIAAKHKIKTNPAIQVVLVESPNVPIIGVGEGTWPTMRNTLIQLGISETDFIRECDASFKQGAKFARWVDGSDSDFYYHPLVLPQGFGKVNLVPYWLRERLRERQQNTQQKHSFSQSVCFQEAVCEQGLAPKTIRTAEFNAVANYAYHLDAGKFAQLLQRHCTENLGVQHVLDDVVDIRNADNGDVAALVTAQNGDIHGDLFVDCSGFKSLLLGEHLGVPFKDCSDVLFIDSALAVQIPYDSEDSPIASHTISTAQEAGWIWDIGLKHRRGIGHVFSSRHTDEQAAYEALGRYIGRDLGEYSVRKIDIKSGHRAKFWQKNVVAVGLSAGFLEPLEASALVLVELSAQMIAEQLPGNRTVMDIVAKRFNETFLYRWDRIIDFLKLHYILSKRTDNKFWDDNRDPQTIPDSLQELMTLWRYHPPYDHDFTSNNEVFPAASYQYVLYGMGFESDLSHIQHGLMDAELANEQFMMNQKNIAQACAKLPSNRDLLNKIAQYGLQRI